MDRRLVILALGMFALGTDSFVVAGVLPQIAGTYHVSIGVAGALYDSLCVVLRVVVSCFRRGVRSCRAQEGDAVRTGDIHISQSGDRYGS